MACEKENSTVATIFLKFCFPDGRFSNDNYFISLGDNVTSSAGMGLRPS
jgi:hypothetical protein